LGGKARNIENGYKLCCSRGGSLINVVEICLSEEWQNRAIATERASDRMMAMKLITDKRHTT